MEEMMIGVGVSNSPKQPPVEGFRELVEIAVRYPPGLSIAQTQNPGPVLVECGHRVRLRGVLVECVRPARHSVSTNHGHSNGYDEWCFDSDPFVSVERIAIRDGGRS